MISMTIITNKQQQQKTTTTIIITIIPKQVRKMIGIIRIIAASEIE
jgi:hypothetical protein